ncbi:MAG: MBL fold metallo-hydrolase [Clostridia bacterium]|nr:MBL fold metallo-hydrolase [Clostridia bacterium]
MKRFLIVLLCLAMILPCVVSCKNDGNTDDTDAPEVQGVDISEYTIIIPKTAGGELRQQSQTLVSYIFSHTGVDIKVKTDDAVAAEDASKEILLGETNRPQSADALAAAGERGFAVKYSGNKVAIVGTSDAINADAIQWFIKNYVQDKSGDKCIYMDETLNVVKAYTLVKLVDDGKSNFSVVYSGSLDDNNGKPLQAESGYAHGGIDYEVQLAYDIKTKLEELTGATVEVKTDDEAATGAEILVGKTNRAAYNTVMSQIGYVQYGVGYADGSIVVAGHNTASNALACEYFIDQLKNSGKTVALSVGDASMRSNSDWTSAFPQYDGGTVSGTSESYYDELQYYITGTNETEYRAYCEKLAANGYTLHMSNEIPGKLISNTYKNNMNVIHVYFAHAENSTRIIVGNLSKVTYPEPNAGEYEKITDVQITQIQLDYTTNSGGMGYIVTLEDGSFLMIDSGSFTSSSASAAGKENKDHIRIWNLLNKLNKREDGKIIIRGWFITHCHADHIRVFEEFCKTYGSKVTIEKYYECVVPESIAYNSKNPDFHVIDGRVDRYLGYVSNKCEKVTLHTGMQMDMYGVELEVLFTVEDIYPQTLHYYNNASSVFRLKANGIVSLFLGDACDVSSDIMSARYGDYLKSHIVQVAHHGNIGATTELYDLVDPVIAFWPTSETLFANLTSGKGNQRYYVVNYHLYKEMNVQENYTNSDYSVTLTFTEKGYTLGSAVKHKIGTTDQYK